jgi:sugar transferase (PEP-CTERM system associated)
LRILSYHFSTQALFIVAVDLVCALTSVFASVLIVNVVEAGPADVFPSRYAVSAAVYAGLIVVGMGAMGLYDSRQRYGLEGALVRMLLAVCLAAVGMSWFAFLFDLIERRIVWVLSFGGSIVLLGLARIFFDRFIEDEVFRRRVLVYGAGERASAILQLRRRSDQRGFRIIGFVPAEGDSKRIEDPRVLDQTTGSLQEFAKSRSVSEIVVAIDDRRKGFPLSDLLTCRLSGIWVTDLLDFLERETGRVKVNIMNPSWLIFSRSFNRTNREGLSFKLLDLAIAGAALILASPLMALVAVLIMLEDGRPILYRQARVGFGGRVFPLYKFRSMRKDAEAAGQAVWASVDDPRTTRQGRWLRRLRVDELPQLFNVVRGEMSLVGPRPERPEFVASLAERIPYYHQRHYVKPGITGWAQLCYPYGASERDALAKLEFDLYYVKNRSVIFYLMILLQTAEVILWQKGSR